MANQIQPYLRKEATINGVTNTFFNGVISWLLLKGGDNLLWSGKNSFVIDLFATAFILPFIIALIIIPLHRRKLRLERLPSVSIRETLPTWGWVEKFPQSLMGNAALFGLIGMLVVTPITVALVWLVGIDQFTPLQYAIFKGVWAGILAAVLVMPMILVGLRAPQQA
jgi:hypothetical protein